MIGRSVIIKTLLLLTLGSTKAIAHGSIPEYGACFRVGKDAASICVPLRMSLIEIETTDGSVWAHFEEGPFAVKISVWPGVGKDFARPDSFSAAYPISKTAMDANRFKKELRRKAFSPSGDCLVLEVETGDNEVSKLHSEITCPAGTLHFAMTDFALQLEDVDLDFRKAVREIRFLTNTREHDLENLHPYDEMDGADAQ